MNSDPVQIRCSLCARIFGGNGYLRTHLTRVHLQHNHNGSVDLRAPFALPNTSPTTYEEEWVYEGLLGKRI